MWTWLLRFTWSPGRRLILFAAAVAVMLAWATFASAVLQRILGPDAYDGVAVPSEDGSGFPSAVLVLALILAVEEVVRLAPLAIVVWLSKRRPLPVMIAAALTAAAFGAVHVSNGLPLVSALAVQGVLGFVMNLVYLKCGGLHGYKFAGFTAAFTTHFLYDIVVIWLAFSG